MPPSPSAIATTAAVHSRLFTVMTSTLRSFRTRSWNVVRVTLKGAISRVPHSSRPVAPIVELSASSSCASAAPSVTGTAMVRRSVKQGADPLVLAAALGGRLANGHLLEPEVPDGGADLDNGQRGGPLAEAVVTQGAGKQHRDHHPGNQVQRPADDLDPHVQSCARPPHMHAAAHRSRSTAI